MQGLDMFREGLGSGIHRIASELFQTFVNKTFNTRRFDYSLAVFIR